MRKNEDSQLLTFEWLEKSSFRGDRDEFYINAAQQQTNPIKICIEPNLVIDGGGFWIYLWDEDQQMNIFRGTGYTIGRLKQLYQVLSGKELK